MVIRRSFTVLTGNEKRKTLLIIILQIFLAILDLFGVILIGILGSITINGINSNKIGNRTNELLNFMNLAEKSLQQQVIYLGIFASILLIFKTIFSLYFTKKSLYFLSRRAATLSATLVSKILSQSILFIYKRSIQESIYMVTSGVSSITVGILGSVIYLVSDFALLIVMVSGLFIVDPLISILTTSLFVLIALTLYKGMHKKVEKFGEQQAILSIKSSEKISEVLGSYRELFVKDRRNFYSNEIGNLRYKLADAMAENTFYQNINKYVLEISIVIGALLISAIEFSTQSPTRAIAVLSIFLVASLRIGPSVLRVQQVFLTIKASIASALPTLELIEELKDININREESRRIETNYEGFRPSVSIENLTFTYPGSDIAAVSGINLEIKPGSVTAIVGPSGSGKTTLIDLILGIISTSQNEIRISGLIPNLAIKKWPGAISYVAQDTLIINGTIKDNVTLGFNDSEIKQDSVKESLRIAQLEEFISELPNGIDTLTGDRGTKISGGQRQRLGIARAMFTKPLLLILDEATSSLDGLTEANVSESVQSMRGKVTLIIVAHRLSTVRNADKVVYLEKGEIISSGTFEEVRNSVPNFDQQARLMGL